MTECPFEVGDKIKVSERSTAIRCRGLVGEVTEVVSSVEKYGSEQIDEIKYFADLMNQSVEWFIDTNLNSSEYHTAAFFEFELEKI